MINLRTAFTVSEGKIYLCYYNPTSDKLEEISDRILLDVLPFEETIRRFYLVHPELTDSSYISIETSVEGAQRYTYEVKVLLGKEDPTVGDFDYAYSGHTLFKIHCEKVFNNAIPVDIFLKSFNATETQAYINISITTNKQECVPT